MIKIYITCIIGAISWCFAAQACSPRLDGKPTNCPDTFDIEEVKLPVQELKGEIDIYDPMHWHQMHMMFIRNVRKEQMEKNMTQPSDAINKALMEFNYGQNGTTEQKELLQLPSDGD